MDNCETFKSLILTDYIDGEIGQLERGRLESHLASCPSCRVFAQEVKQQVVTPFKGMPRKAVPDHVWASIKETIEQQVPSGYSFLDQLGAWARSLSFPCLASVFASVAVLSFITVGMMHNHQIKSAKEKEQGVYLAYLIEDPGFDVETGDDGLATPIEKYFL